MRFLIIKNNQDGSSYLYIFGFLYIKSRIHKLLVNKRNLIDVV